MFLFISWIKIKFILCPLVSCAYAICTQSEKNKGPPLTFWNYHFGVGMKLFVFCCFLFLSEKKEKKKNCKQQSFKILNVIKWGSSRPVHKLKKHFTTVKIIQSDKIKPIPMRKETKATQQNRKKKNKKRNSSHSKMLKRKKAFYCLDNNYKNSMGILVFSVLALLSAVCTRCNNPGREREKTL